MTQYSTAARNGMLDSLETTLGASARLQVYSGAAPASCAAAPTGTKLLEIALAADWAGAAAAAAKALTGTPLATTALAAGTVGYYRFVDAAGTTCHAQGPASQTGGSGEVTFDNGTFTAGQNVSVTGYQFTVAGG